MPDIMDNVQEQQERLIVAAKGQKEKIICPFCGDETPLAADGRIECLCEEDNKNE